MDTPTYVIATCDVEGYSAETIHYGPVSDPELCWKATAKKGWYVFRINPDKTQDIIGRWENNKWSVFETK